KYMWRGRFVWTRVLFWMVRVHLLYETGRLDATPLDASLFVPVTGTDLIDSCTFWFKWFLYANIVTRVTISGILIMRVYVMYGCRRDLLIILCTLFVVELIAETVIFVESLLFVLALVKFIQQLRPETHTPRLMAVLLMDSLLYFIGALCAILINFIAWMNEVQLDMSVHRLTVAVNSLLGCHMLVRPIRLKRLQSILVTLTAEHPKRRKNSPPILYNRSVGIVARGHDV
ncbi:hypothetical protein WOLCODRAFT_83447, partial [Wolfiporia cocos MD-104 SS10]